MNERDPQHQSIVRPVPGCDCNECTCLHPIKVDVMRAGLVWLRGCAMCGFGYNRTVHVLDPLREQCEAAWTINFTRFSLDSDDAQEIAG